MEAIAADMKSFLDRNLSEQLDLDCISDIHLYRNYVIW